MPHYFTENNNTLKSNPNEIAFGVNGTNLKFITDHGVFSKDGFDRGTKVLLEYLQIPDNTKSILDLGCGYGVVGVYLGTVYDLEIDMVDINLRAIKLSKQNIALNNVEANVFQSDGFSNVGRNYDLIVTNPPIRAGKKVIYRFFSESIDYLNENGYLVLVINKKHGAASAIKYLETIYKSVEIVGHKKGFQVILCKK